MSARNRLKRSTKRLSLAFRKIKVSQSFLNRKNLRAQASLQDVWVWPTQGGLLLLRLHPTEVLLQRLRSEHPSNPLSMAISSLLMKAKSSKLIRLPMAKRLSHAILNPKVLRAGSPSKSETGSSRLMAKHEHAVQSSTIEAPSR